MLAWKVLVVAVFSCNVCMCTAQQRGKALYPAAVRIKRGSRAMVKPTFQNSIEDINLLYEIMLTGFQIGDEDVPFSVQDEELASLRRIRTLQAICQDVLPKRLTDIRRLVADLSQRPGPLQKGDFEKTVLTMVYAANRLANTMGHQKNNWAESFVSLYRALKRDLRGQRGVSKTSNDI